MPGVRTVAELVLVVSFVSLMSLMLFQLPHTRHFPDHFTYSVPHSIHSNCGFFTCFDISSTMNKVCYRDCCCFLKVFVKN